MHTTIYCLELVGGRYYIGQTPLGRFDCRYKEHFLGGAKWTTRFKPVKVLWTKAVSCSEADEAEDSAVLEVMLEHGPNSCRGGSFNIGKDITKCPWWAKSHYRDNWGQIASR